MSWRGRECRRQEAGDRRQETGDRRQETGDRRQETVHGNEAIISKEIWLMLSDAESALALTSLDVLYQRYLADWVTYRRPNAPCVLRKIIVGSSGSDQTTPKRLARRIVRALHRDSRNIVVHSHPLVHLYQPVREWMTATYLQVKH